MSGYVQICTEWLQQNGEPSITQDIFRQRVGADAINVAGYLLAGRWHSVLELAKHTGLADTQVVRAIMAIGKHTPGCLKLDATQRGNGENWFYIYSLHRQG